jgi:hypothetical protein
MVGIDVIPRGCWGQPRAFLIFCLTHRAIGPACEYWATAIHVHCDRWPAGNLKLVRRPTDADIECALNHCLRGLMQMPA